MMDTALVLLHAVVGLLFVGHGAQKLLGVLGGDGLEGTAGFMDTFGLRSGRLHATAAGVAEFTGGLLVALGHRQRARRRPPVAAAASTRAA